MENKFTSVKNPLTVIAIFAGIAEISGTVVLPHIAVSNQAVYIWFLMLFPFALIFIFFLTLNFNHRVLYAPSDFRDEDNFVNILKKSTFKEVLEYKTNEVISLGPEVQTEVPESPTEQSKDSISNISSPATLKDETSSEMTSATEMLLSNAQVSLLELSQVTNRSQRTQLDLISRQISDRRIRDARLAEMVALTALEKELGVQIEREMKIEVGSTSVFFDGVARRGSSLTAFEIKYFRSKRSAPMNSMMWMDLRRKLEALFQSLSDEQRRDFSFVLVIVNDGDASELESMAMKRLSELPFPIAVKFYDFDTLIASYAKAA